MDGWEKKIDDFTPEKIDQLVKNGRQGYILENDVEHLKQMHKKHSELPFLAERMKVGKVETLIQIFNDKETYAVRIKNLNETLKHCLKMKKDTLDYQI